MDSILDRRGRSLYPQEILDRIYMFGKNGEEFRRLCYTSRKENDMSCFAFFRNQILRHQKVMETTIVGELKQHIGVYIENPTTARHNGMVAVVHPSKIFTLFNLKLQRQITLDSLNAVECKETLQYLKQHVKIVQPESFCLFIRNCNISADDIAAFVNDSDPSKRILRLQLLYKTVILQGPAELLNKICCTRVRFDADSGSFNSAQRFNYFLNAVMRQESPLYKLDIESAYGRFDDASYSAFVKRNIVIGGKFGVDAYRLPEPSSKPTQLSQIYGPFDRKLAFYRFKRTNKWAWRHV
uniref:DUF38 domain-containing protein n=1 Tax=Panagrolaimus sp. PS1159 TaxID=55785 RepID=A0AC35GEK3_9BILA